MSTLSPASPRVHRLRRDRRRRALRRGGHGNAARPSGHRRAAARPRAASRATSRTGHFIHRHGPRRLADWGLLDRVLATNCPPVASFTTDFGDFPLVGNESRRRRVRSGSGRDAPGSTPLWSRPRSTPAPSCGRGSPSTSSRTTATGSRASAVARTGGATTERATVVIGADGRNSRSRATCTRPSMTRHRRSPAGTSPTGAAWPPRARAATCATSG